MDWDKLESVPAVGEEGDEPSTSKKTGDMDPEMAMLAKQLGFEGEKAEALRDFVKLCYASE